MYPLCNHAARGDQECDRKQAVMHTFTMDLDGRANFRHRFGAVSL
jgi:hypothetical protein